MGTCTSVLGKTWSSLFGFLVLLIKYFKNRHRRMLGDSLTSVLEKNNKIRLDVLASTG